MLLSLVCTIRDAKNSIIKYRVIDLDTSKVRDLTYSELLEIHKRDGVQELKKNKVKGKNTKIEDYPYIVENSLKELNKLIAVAGLYYKGNQVGYRACNYFGDIVDISNNLLSVRRISKVLLNMDSIANNRIDISGSIDNSKYSKLSNVSIELKEYKTKKLIIINSAEGRLEASVINKNTDVIWIENINIKKRCIGKHAGKLMYAKLEHIARNIDGVKEIKVGIDSIVPMLFFESLGFELVDYIEDNITKPESSIWARRLWQ